MARPKKTDAPDLAHPIELTAGAIERLTCPSGKQQAFLRDSKAPGLRVRVTAAGAKSFVFEAKLNRQTIRRTIGDVRAWTIEQARVEANRQRVTLDAGQDPRELERQREAAQLADLEAQQSAVAAAALTVGEAWAAYIEARRPRWGERHLQDHHDLSTAGGEQKKRGEGLTKPGPLHAFMGQPLCELTAARVDAWATTQADMRPTQARLALRLLRAFVNWCTRHEQYGGIVPAGNAATSPKAREALGTAKPKHDALMREQLPAWFAAVRGLGNPVAAAYLQAVLLTGARPGEVLAMRWEHLNLQWRGLTLRDKVEGERVIPLTPYVAHLLAGLPRRGPFVFQGAQAGGEPRPIRKPNHINARVCKAAAIEGLTLQGLRRSFGSLAEWLEIPAGVVAQIQGHKPSATAEKHYRVRPLDLLRVHHERIEAWMLEQAGIDFTPQAQPGKLRAVK